MPSGVRQVDVEARRRRSTGSGTMKTSLYVRSWPGSGCSRRIGTSSGGLDGARVRATQCYGPLRIRVFGASECSGGGHARAAARHSDGAGRRVGCPNLRAWLPLRSSVVLVHGWGGSFETTWRQSGFTELLEDAGRRGHRRRPARARRGPEAARPRRVRRHDDAHRRRAARRPVDIVGFSLGAITTLRLATGRPGAVPAGIVLSRRRPQPVRARRRRAQADPRRRRGHRRPRRQRRPPVRPVRHAAGQRPRRAGRRDAPARRGRVHAPRT